MSWKYRYFTAKEFACKCGCGLGESLDHVDVELLARLSTVREQFGPMTVSSGVRCMLHNQAAGGKPASAHIAIPGQQLCRAVDIRCTDSISRGKLLALVYQQFQRVGLHKNFIHMDVAGGPDYVAPATWFY